MENAPATGSAARYAVHSASASADGAEDSHSMNERPSQRSAPKYQGKKHNCVATTARRNDAGGVEI